ncbi:MAG TPA: type II toxin-antitoxin system VapC family toxin [Myxococcota bacterium]|nr:type II toxin-antitoxin system VapC family toxin [Myxococcota bacterium]
MIALDTNVLVRFLVEDHEAQSKAAKRLIKKVTAADDLVFVADIVMVETVWVLSRSYGFSKSEIVKAMHLLLSARNLKWESTDRIARVLDAFEKGRGGFADYLVRQMGRENGCRTVATFDSKLLKEEGFVKPG